MAEIKTEKQFREYAETVLKKAFKDDFDQKKCDKLVDDILKKHGDDFGAAVGVLTSGLGEEFQIEEAVDFSLNYYIENDKEILDKTIKVIKKAADVIGKTVSIDDSYKLKVKGKNQLSSLLETLVRFVNAFDEKNTSQLLVDYGDIERLIK